MKQVKQLWFSANGTHNSRGSMLRLSGAGLNKGFCAQESGIDVTVPVYGRLDKYLKRPWNLYSH